jgi:hypothetical protein
MASYANVGNAPQREMRAQSLYGYTDDQMSHGRSESLYRWCKYSQIMYEMCFCVESHSSFCSLSASKQQGNMGLHAVQEHVANSLVEAIVLFHHLFQFECI